MNLYKETADTWNKIADLYQERFMDLTIYNPSYDIFCNSITQPSPHILEIGCGPGNITKYLLTKRPDFILHGIDIAPNMITLARQNNPSGSFSVMDCRNIHELTTTYEGIICGFCLPYLTEADSIKLFSDLSNLLNPGGFVYISFVEGPPEQSGYQTNSRGDRMYFQYYTLAFITNQLLASGFMEPQILEVPYQKSDGTSEKHTVVIARRK